MSELDDLRTGHAPVYVCGTDFTSVQNKLHHGDGMSFAEFSYPLLQAWDWWHMYCNHGVVLQIGGSDQYGNIIAGMDAIKHIAPIHPDRPILHEAMGETLTPPIGLTVPLLTTSSGAKFGKSAGNAVWLSSELLSNFDFYGVSHQKGRAGTVD